MKPDPNSTPSRPEGPPCAASVSPLSVEERQRLLACLAEWARRVERERPLLRARAQVSARTLEFVFSR